MSDAAIPSVQCDCITCSDAAAPMDVLAVEPGGELALCADAAGERMTVQTELVADVSIGERLLVHAGTAIARLEV